MCSWNYDLKLFDIHALDNKMKHHFILIQHTSLDRPDIFQTSKTLAINKKILYALIY